MSEFRQNIITKEWVLIAPKRSGRPQEFPKEPATSEVLPEWLETCVFCPGNEKQTPPEIIRYADVGDWQIRVVPNKFGLLELGAGRPERNFYTHLPGIGTHEVLITRVHNQITALQSVKLIDLTLKAYIDRINELSLHETVKYVHIIQNFGKLAGATIVHPHSQIFAMPFVGPHLYEEIRGAYHYYNIFDRCIYCEIMLYERRQKERIVLQTDNFVAICPYESKMPYQMRIMPKSHEAKFNNISEDQRSELANMLKSLLLKLYNKLGNPAYNYYIHTMPFPRAKNVAYEEASFHWHLVIMPRLDIWAGLELGTEIYVNKIAPEQAAEYLRL